MSLDFHILYDSIIHSLQNWLPVNLIAVTLVSHKYANITRACRALWEQKGSSRGDDLPQKLPQISKSFEDAAHFFCLSPSSSYSQAFWGSHSDAFCQNVAGLLVTANLITQKKKGVLWALDTGRFSFHHCWSWKQTEWMATEMKTFARSLCK